MKGSPILFSMWLVAACGIEKPVGNDTRPVSYETYTELLQNHVNEDGMVDYKSMYDDRQKLDNFLNKLASRPPSGKWSDSEKLAYWINAYNAFTLQLILDHYPVQSIKDIGSLLQIPYVNSVFDIRFIEINGKKMDLNYIEHQILRKEFEEPRIHFAINCASISCPPLRREAYEASELDQQLTSQAKLFIQGPENKITPDRIKLSKIFSWFKKDFTQNMSLTEYIDQYTPVSVNNNATIQFGDYDWSLNSQ